MTTRSLPEHPAWMLGQIPKSLGPIWYTNPYAIGFREQVDPGATVTLHPTWGTYDGFDAFRPCGFHVGVDTAFSFQIERLTIEGRPQTLGGSCGPGPCPAAIFSFGDIPYGSTGFDACAFGGSIDLCVRNEGTTALLFVALLSGPTRVAQSVVDEVARADWSMLTGPQRRAILRYGHLGGGFPRKKENMKAMDEALIALGLVAPYTRGGCLPTARGLALSARLAYEEDHGT